MYYALHRNEGRSYSASMTLADFVRDARNRRGMTQEQLAEAINKSFGYVGQLETGKIDRPKADTLRALASALRVPLEDLLVATGQLDAQSADGADPAALILQLDALPTREARLAAFRQLPLEVRRSIRRLMSDLFSEAAELLVEEDQP